MPIRPSRVLAVCTALLWGPSATAHPHVFADTSVDFVFGEGGTLDALKITWIYDELTSLVLLDTLDLDRDGDGLLDDADRARIVAGETEWDPDYNGDIHLHAPRGPVAMARPQNGAARMENDRIQVSFDLPLAAPVAAQALELSLYDPFYYYAYTILPETALMEAPQGCAATLIPFVPDESTAELRAQLALLSQEEIPPIENVGALFADKLRLSCD